MDVRADEIEARVVKVATSHWDRARLAHEAEVLALLAHPGVVQALSFESDADSDTLTVARVEGLDLGSMELEDPSELAGLGAALLTTVSDLHALGFTHGALEESHVIVDNAGRPILCSLGRSTRATDGLKAADFKRLCQQDVRAVAALLVRALTPTANPRLNRLLVGVCEDSQRRWPRRSCPPDARRLAARLLEVCPDARLPRRSPPAERDFTRVGGGDGRVSSRPDLSSLRAGEASGAPAPTHRPPGRRRMALIVCAAGAISAGAWLGTSATRSAHPRAVRFETAMSNTTARPARLSVTSEVLIMRDGHFRLSALQGATTVIGRWDCRATATPALLEPDLGNIWIFDRWPQPGQHVTARLLLRVPSATKLQVRTDRFGCDVLSVRRRDGTVTLIDPRAT